MQLFVLFSLWRNKSEKPLPMQNDQGLARGREMSDRTNYPWEYVDSNDETINWPCFFILTMGNGREQIPDVMNNEEEGEGEGEEERRWSSNGSFDHSTETKNSSSMETTTAPSTEHWSPTNLAYARRYAASKPPYSCRSSLSLSPSRCDLSFRYLTDCSCHCQFSWSYVYSLSDLSIHPRSLSLLSTESTALAELHSTFVVVQRLFRQSSTQCRSTGEGIVLDIASRQWQHVREWMLPSTTETIQDPRETQSRDERDIEQRAKSCFVERVRKGRFLSRTEFADQEWIFFLGDVRSQQQWLDVFPVDCRCEFVLDRSFDSQSTRFQTILFDIHSGWSSFESFSLRHESSTNIECLLPSSTSGQLTSSLLPTHVEQTFRLSLVLLLLFFFSHQYWLKANSESQHDLCLSFRTQIRERERFRSLSKEKERNVVSLLPSRSFALSFF